MKDLRGQRFGRLVALYPTQERHRTSVVWRCRCDCGAECRVPSEWLRRGVQRSCGCLQDESRRKDITGVKRGHLTAVRRTGEIRGGYSVWAWRCDCGAIIERTTQDISKYKSTMCPACAAKLKGEQARAAVTHVQRDPSGIATKQRIAIQRGTLPKNNSSGVRGVSWSKRNGKWLARINEGGRTVSLGYYDTLEEAKAARMKAVARKYGAAEDKE